jgi:hypothetical protein|eukprot:COSAG01_NODE_18039_length_1104_cov_1.177114_1_plen_74_part_00
MKLIPALAALGLAGTATAQFGQTNFANNPIKVGATLPSIDLDLGFPPQKINILERAKGKKIILVGLPGAFTPT